VSFVGRGYDDHDDHDGGGGDDDDDDDNDDDENPIEPYWILMKRLVW